jgi:putative ABC transport system permease protein
MKKYFLLAFKNLKRRGIRSWLTMLGIFIGIAAVVSLIMLGNGLREAIVGQFGGLSSDKLTITNAETGFGPPGSTAVEKLTSHDLKIIESVSGVELVIPRLIRSVTVEYDKRLAFSFAVSMPEDDRQNELIYGAFSAEAEEGRLLKKEDRGKILLGHDFTNERTLGKEVKVGDNLRIQGKDFEVIGLLKAASSFQLNLAILMTESDLNDALDIKDEYDIIVVQLEKNSDPEKVAEAIREKLRKDRGLKEGEEDFNVQTPIAALASINTILNVINVIVIGIALISLLVGAIGIANTMYTSVLERTKEIGVMKAIGARNSDILLIFLFESGLLGLVGGVVGVLIGMLMAWTAATGANTALGNNLFIIKLNPALIIGSIIFSFIIGTVSGVLPARQASKLKPVDALRG